MARDSELRESAGLREEAGPPSSEPVESAIAEAGTLQRVDAGKLTVPGEEEIASIVRDEDPVRRNFRITDAYHRLSAGMAVVVDARNVNWSTFATWASKTAGESIRKEVIPKFFVDTWRFDERMAAQLPGWLRRFEPFARRVRRAALETLQEVSSEVATGNLKVFEELAPVFRHFIDLAQEAMTEERLKTLIEGLQPGPVEEMGQDLLRAAFTDYAQVPRCPSAEERAERMLLANCRIGLHEQTRLQPHIEAAMSAPIHSIFTRRLKALLPRVVGGLLAWIIRFFTRKLLREVTRDWQEIATRHAMNLSLPGGNGIPLSGDVPDPPGGIPPELKSIELPELRELFVRFHVNLESNAGSAAQNWARLDERMRFIVALFRSRQQDTSLFGPPLSDAEWAGSQRQLVARTG